MIFKKVIKIYLYFWRKKSDELKKIGNLSIEKET